jgi:phosphate transport system substrate-binding protein
MKKYHARTVVLLLLGVLSGCATAGKVPSDPVVTSSAAIPPESAVTAPAAKAVTTIRIGGEEGAIGGFILPVKETFEEENGAGLTVTLTAPGKELIDLEEGRVDAVVSTMPLSVLVAAAAREKVMVEPATLRQFDVGKNDTVVFLNNKNRIKRLSRNQLKAIFTGRIGNWKQVGGANRTIVIVWNAASSSESEAFLKEILKGAQFTHKVKKVGSYDEVRSHVMATPGAIGIAPHGFVSKLVKVPKMPMVESNVILVTKGEPTPEIKKLLELLADAQFIQ